MLYDEKLRFSDLWLRPRGVSLAGSARGNWDPREVQQPFRPNLNGVGDRTTTLRRLLIGAAILKPGGLLRWKVRFVKDARLLLLLTEVMMIARLTSPLLDAPRQSSPRLRHGRRLALLFHPNQTRKLYTFFSVLSLVRLPPLLISPTVLLPGNRLRSMPLT